MITVGERIRERRRELNMTQTELAERAEIADKTAISRIEHSGNDVTMRQVRKLAPALQTTQAYLMGWETDVDLAKQNEEPATPFDIEIRDALIEPYTSDQIKHAVEFCKKYLAADPNLQNAIDLLLKGNQSDV